MKKEITFEPAFDKRDADSKKNYGVHGVTLRFVYGDEKGYVQFVLYTNWHLPEVTAERANMHYEPIAGDAHWMERPLPADLGYHSPTPHYEGQTKMEHCDYLKGGCYYDGSGLNAERIYHVLLREGSEGV